MDDRERQVAAQTPCGLPSSCICPAACDCQAPGAEVALCSNLCPEHNLYPLVDDECEARQHRNGGLRRSDQEAE